MGPGQKCLTQVGLDNFFASRVGSATCRSGKFTSKMIVFSIFVLSGQKIPRTKLGWPFIYCGSEVYLGGSALGPYRTRISFPKVIEAF